MIKYIYLIHYIFLLNDNCVRLIQLYSDVIIVIPISIGSYSTSEMKPFPLRIILHKGNSVSQVAAVICSSISFEGQNVVVVAWRFGVEDEIKTDPEQ